MILIPKPKNIIEKKGILKLKTNFDIVLINNSGFEEFEFAKELKKYIKNTLGMNLNIKKGLKKANAINIVKEETYKKEGYKIEITQSQINLIGSKEGLFYSIQTLKQILKQKLCYIPCMQIDDEPKFELRGYYYDVTRGRVPTIETLKEVVDKISHYKINHLQIYIEHTFLFEGFSEMWTGKDPLTAEEILELDMYAKSKNVELVPSIATFGHLYHPLSTNTFGELSELEGRNMEFSWVERMLHHTLNPCDEKSLKFVENMLNQIIPLFSSDKVNICGDETYDLGVGKSKEEAKENGKGRLYVDFLKKICNIVEKHNKKPMFWGDIILKYPELLSEMPENAVCLNWEYREIPDEGKIIKVKESEIPQVVCPGTNGWNRLMNEADISFSNIKYMAEYGEKHGAMGVLNTDWGDYGHVNMFTNSIPSIIFGAAMSWNTNDKRSFEEFDRDISLIEFEDLEGSICRIMREAGRCHSITWGDLIWFLERRNKKFIETEFLKDIERYYENRINKNSIENTIEMNLKLTELIEEIECKRVQIPTKNYEIQEVALGIQAIKWINLFNVYTKQSNGYDTIKMHKTPFALAEEIECWFYEFSKKWRQKNKESELYRIRESVEMMCKYLRTIEF